MNTARKDQPLYQLFDPEGTYMGGSFDLPVMKLTAERFARERDEFANFGASLEQAKRAIEQQPRQQ